MKKLYPKEYVDSIFSIDYEKLKGLGITTLIYDIDNTLAPFDVQEPDEELIAHLKSLTDGGFNIGLVSNNKAERVTLFNKNLNYNVVFKAGKPKKSGLLKSIRYFKETPQNIALIGDQIFTDVLGGNRLGMYTILVKPIADRDEFTVRLKRGIEKLVINRFLKNTGK